MPNLNILQGIIYSLSVILAGYFIVVITNIILSALRNYLIRLYNGNVCQRLRSFVRTRIEEDRDHGCIRFSLDCLAKLISFGKTVVRSIRKETRNVLIKIGIRQPTGIDCYKKKDRLQY